MLLFQNAGIFVAGWTQQDKAIPGQTSVGKSDLFAVAIDKDGKQLWSDQYGSPGEDDSLPYNHARDPQGSHYIVATSISDPSFSGYTCISCGKTEILIVKYTSDGQRLWTKRHGTEAGGAGAAGIKVTAAGRVFISGVAEGLLPGATCDGDCGSRSAFVAEISPTDGSLTWVLQFAGVESKVYEDVSVSGPLMVDPQGYLYVRYNVNFASYDGGLVTYIRKIQPGSAKHVWQYKLPEEAYVYSGILIDNTRLALAAGHVVQVDAASGKPISSINVWGDAYKLAYDKTGRSLMVTGEYNHTQKEESSQAFIASIGIDSKKPRWQKNIRSDDRRILPQDTSMAVAVDSTGAAYTVNVFVPNTTASSYLLSFAKFAAKDGALVWQKEITSPEAIVGAHQLLLDSTGGLYGVGISGGAFQDATPPLDTSVREWVGWVAKLNATTGRLLWMNQYTGVGSEWGVTATDFL